MPIVGTPRPSGDVIPGGAASHDARAGPRSSGVAAARLAGVQYCTLRAGLHATFFPTALPAAADGAAKRARNKMSRIAFLIARHDATSPSGRQSRRGALTRRKDAQDRR